MRPDQSNIDKSRLHAGQNTQHPTLVNIAGDIGVVSAVDVKLGDVAVVQQRDSGFMLGYINYELFVHGSPDPRVVAVAVESFNFDHLCLSDQFLIQIENMMHNRCRPYGFSG